MLKQDFDNETRHDKQHKWQIALTQEGPVLFSDKNVVQVEYFDWNRQETCLAYQSRQREHQPTSEQLEDLVQIQFTWDTWNHHDQTCCVCCQKIRFENLLVDLCGNSVEASPDNFTILHEHCEKQYQLYREAEH